MVEGPSITPFAYDCGNNYHIIPYDQDDTSSPVLLDDLLRGNEELAIYFSQHRSLLDKQSDKSKTMHRGSEFYALSKIGKYTFAPYIVAARDNSSFCSSIIRPVLTPWGEYKQAICVKHTIIISQDINGDFITKDESHYINAILNSKIVHAYIHATFKTNGFSLKKSNLCIPKYDSDNQLHKRLVILSKYATLEKNASKRKRVSEIASSIYCQICQNCKNAKNNQLQGQHEEIEAFKTKEEISAIGAIIIDSDIFQRKADKAGFIPLFSLRAACGKFEGEDQPDEEGWVDASGSGFTPDPKRHFAVHAKGNSMYPDIKDGDICVFEWYNQTGGTREGDIVLAEYDGIDDEATIKKYHSVKVQTEEGWRHEKIELIPRNKDFDTIMLEEGSQYRIIGVFKCVITQ